MVKNSTQSEPPKSTMVQLGDTGYHVLRPSVVEDGRVYFFIDGEYLEAKLSSEGRWKVAYAKSRRLPTGAKTIKEVPPRPKRKA